MADPLAEVLPFAELIERAAFVIRQSADDLRLSHTVRGRWPAGEESVRNEYDELTALAARLSKSAKYHRPNPLGGPAVVFDACADSIRAGDPIDAAMRDYGLAWRRTSSAARGVQVDAEPDNIREFLHALQARNEKDNGLFPQVAAQVEADAKALRRVLAVLDFYHPPRTSGARVGVDGLPAAAPRIYADEPTPGVAAAPATQQVSDASLREIDLALAAMVDLKPLVEYGQPGTYDSVQARRKTALLRAERALLYLRRELSARGGAPTEKDQVNA